MFLGHYGLAFGAKRAAPETSLGTLTFAAQFLDELWPILLLAGVEQVGIDPGAMAANPLVFTSYPYSHSLATAALWGLLIGGAYYARRRYRRGAIVVALAVVSHWFLDLPMHAPDLPLWPDSPRRVGFGLWNSVSGTLITELAVFLTGVALYVRGTRARDRIGTWGFWAEVVVLLGIYLSGFVTPPPPSVRAVAVASVGIWLFVPWSYWIDRHREPRLSREAPAPGAAPAPA